MPKTDTALSLQAEIDAAAAQMADLKARQLAALAPLIDRVSVAVASDGFAAALAELAGASSHLPSDHPVAQQVGFLSTITANLNRAIELARETITAP